MNIADHLVYCLVFISDFKTAALFHLDKSPVGGRTFWEYKIYILSVNTRTEKKPEIKRRRAHDLCTVINYLFALNVYRGEIFERKLIIIEQCLCVCTSGIVIDHKRLFEFRTAVYGDGTAARNKAAYIHITVYNNRTVIHKL